MRIAQVAPLYESVPPKCYGGTERIVSGVTEELVQRGHKVVLFASGDSTTAAELIACCSQGLRLNHEVQNHMANPVIKLGKGADRAEEFDLIHNHIDYFAFPLSRMTRTPIVTTLHGRLDLPELQDLYAEYPEVPLVSISEAQRHPLPHARWLATIYNGIDLRHFTPRERPGD